jgi:hypothetical protein
MHPRAATDATGAARHEGCVSLSMGARSEIPLRPVRGSGCRLYAMVTAAAENDL